MRRSRTEEDRKRFGRRTEEEKEVEEDWEEDD